ncbi:unnamed protein product [Oncorhynchus mykiss]|uniref:Angiotensin II receptor-associated protein n=1 Tax=Oncorhynchus mykiss TaxID=8022 RepID=A0A060VNN6_ONCMY|nr:unnamed protein product [Oncorhynchus mykiss]
MEIPAINLKAIVLVHWLLTVWGCMAWLPPSYAWGNFSVLALGVWAIAQRDSIDAVLMFLIGIAVTILTDIIHFGICCLRVYLRGTGTHSASVRAWQSWACYSSLSPASSSTKCTESVEEITTSTLQASPV